MQNKIRFPIFSAYRKYSDRIIIELFSTKEKAYDYLRWIEYPIHEKRMNLKDSNYYIESISIEDIDQVSEYVERSLNRLRVENGN
jgi:hypothetical protein